ncbi:hypothetical protein OSB04_021312 [Centaurea solstitialis]|uniref:DUF4283 domain-containing protein n=1 Tax=Centaurea solstitialis TaxID=347529 RepID=A0AA38SVK6_9ASTR|nr:hypothetical protein OSB04_021312 [Centaurea solstitialis]
MAFKRLRNGEKFGFVRFRGVADEKLLEEKLKKIWFGDLNLRVHLANKYERGYGIPVTRNISRPKVERVPPRRSSSDVRSYVDVVKGANLGGFHAKSSKEADESENKTDLKGPNLGSWEAEEDALEYLQRCAVGSVTRMEHVDSIQALISSGTLESCEIKMLGGSDILIKFESKDVAEKVIKNKVHGIHFWAKDLCLWSQGYRASNRLVWLRIVGLPLHIWKVDVFKVIASRWGSVVTTINCDLKNSPNLMWGKVLINTMEEEDGVGLESQIRNYHQQIAGEEDEENELISSSSDWSEEEAGSEEEGSIKESFLKTPIVKGSVDCEERNIIGGGQGVSEWVSQSGGSNQVQSEREAVAGGASSERIPTTRDHVEEEQPLERADIIITASDRVESSKKNIINNVEHENSLGADNSFGPQGLGNSVFGIHGGPPIGIVVENIPPQSGTFNKSPNSNILLTQKSKQSDPIQNGKSKSNQMRKGEVGVNKSKSNFVGVQRNKIRLSEKPGFGRGRASFHCLKQMARSNAKKVSKTKQSKRKSNSSGDLNSSENVVSISSVLKGDGLSENIEEFGSEIGVVWKEAGGLTENC